MPKQKFEVAVYFRGVRFYTIAAKDRQEAIQKAMARADKAGIEVEGGMRVTPLTDLQR